MNYYELSFTYTSPIEKEIINDVLAAELGEIGFESFTESEKGLLGYISEALYDKKTLDDKLADFPLENTRIDYTSKWVELFQTHPDRKRVHYPCLLPRGGARLYI